MNKNLPLQETDEKPTEFVKNFNNYSFQSEKNNFSIQVWKVSFWKLNLILASFKDLSKKKTKLFQSDYIIGSVPFIIGFFEFLFAKHYNQPISYFFEKNLPGISFPSESLQWETFQYIQSKQFEKKELSSFTGLKDNFHQPIIHYYQKNFIKKINFSDNSLVFSLNPFWKSQQKKFYIGNFYQNANSIFVEDPKTKNSLDAREYTREVSKEQLIKGRSIKKVSTKKNSYQISSQLDIDFLNLIKKKSGWILPNILKKASFPQDYLQALYSSLDELPVKLNSIKIFDKKNEKIFDFIVGISSPIHLVDQPNISKVKTQIDSLLFKTGIHDTVGHSFKQTVRQQATSPKKNIQNSKIQVVFKQTSTPLLVNSKSFIFGNISFQTLNQMKWKAPFFLSDFHETNIDFIYSNKTQFDQFSKSNFQINKGFEIDKLILLNTQSFLLQFNQFMQNFSKTSINEDIKDPNSSGRMTKVLGFKESAKKIEISRKAFSPFRQKFFQHRSFLQNYFNEVFYNTGFLPINFISNSNQKFLNTPFFSIVDLFDKDISLWDFHSQFAQQISSHQNKSSKNPFQQSNEHQAFTFYKIFPNFQQLGVQEILPILDHFYLYQQGRKAKKPEKKEYSILINTTETKKLKHTFSPSDFIWTKVLKASQPNRIFSGYQHPDTNRQNLTNYFLRFFSLNIFSLKNLFESAILQSEQKLFLKIQIPENFFSAVAFTEQHSKKSNLFKNISINFQPWSENLLEDLFPQKNYLAGFYKSEPSFLKPVFSKSKETAYVGTLYPTSLPSPNSETNQTKIIEKNLILNNLTLTRIFNKFSTPFQNFYEPLTSKSYLVITKLSFAFFTFKLLQNIYSNYRQELSLLADVLAALGIIDESTKQELFVDENDRGFRILKKIKKRFQDIAGIENILPELGEMVWFLRNSGRSFPIGNLIPKGILLVGPPGTGKTLLVQAIAGEAEVPALVLSGSSLNDPEKPGKGAIRLKLLFQEARNLAPCIVFIDEIDTLGQKRDQVLKNPMGADQVLESISNFELIDSKNSLNLSSQFANGTEHQTSNFGNRSQKNEINFQTLKDSGFDNTTGMSENEILEKTRATNQSKQEQLSLLMQFLVEMDGLQSRNQIIVIGATNRGDVLDSAFLRPGRFDKILELGLPGKQKRIDILKLYSKPLGTNSTINWNYFGDLTLGLSAADLAAIMNESAMLAILQKTVHNLETIEQGIDRITSYSVDKPRALSNTGQPKNLKKSSFSGRERKIQTFESSEGSLAASKKGKQEGIFHAFSNEKEENDEGLFHTVQNTNMLDDPFFLTRLAYYQAGKTLVHRLLPFHPNSIVSHLWPRTKNTRYIRITNNLQKEISEFSRRCELETRIIGFYAGKAAELFLLSSTSELSYVTHDASKLWLSDLGSEDLSFANFLAYTMVDLWYFYSKKIAFRKLTQVVNNRNYQEYPELEKNQLLKQISSQLENPLSLNTNSSNSQLNKISRGIENDSQKRFIRPWWQSQIARELEILDPSYAEWYRLYLPDPEENEFNEEWLPPDEFYHTNLWLNNLLKVKSTQSTKFQQQVDCKQQVKSFKNINKNWSINWNTFYQLERDYIFHGLVLNSFNTALTLLERNRELLDFIAQYLLHYEILRENDLEKIFQRFGVFSLNNFESTEVENKCFSKLETIEKSWGENSRRLNSRFIDFDQLIN